MTPQEMQALDSFLTQLTQARVDAKDPQAASLIAEAVAGQPDAAYLLVQRAMLLDHALATARAQIASLQGQLQSAQANGARSFLDGDNAWGASAGRTAAGPGGPSQSPMSMPPMSMQTPTPAPATFQPPPAQPARSGFLGGGMGSTLGSIATTAAGVAGGAFLFQGIENLFHRGGNGSGFLGQSAGSGAAPTETVVNNFYGNDGDTTLASRDGSSDSGFVDSGLDNGLDDFLNDDTSTF
ncbi:DUF2076 domain-containing protein [Cupriavidus sp. RAF12]|uniref:DUF2076 domain-containing protein n=1 Tax=Cupriavidus sp. RAF12 TaxID=3233050 RepID=UPI003F8DD3C6